MVSKYQIHVHWREHMDNESSSLFRNCEAPDDTGTILAFHQGAAGHFVNIAATQLITITLEKETA